MGVTVPYPVRRTSDTRRGAFAKSCCLLRYCRSAWPMGQLSESFNTTNIASQIPRLIAMRSSHTCRLPCTITGSGYSHIRMIYRRTFRFILMDGAPETGTDYLGQHRLLPSQVRWLLPWQWALEPFTIYG